MFRKLASITQRLRIPCVCILCKQYHNNCFAICNACYELLIPIPYACQYCAMPLPDEQFLTCGQCITKSPHFTMTHAPFPYEEPLKSLIREFKYHNGIYLRSFLSQLIINTMPISARKTECLIPVPMHPLRLKQRGFNHAVELAKYLGSFLKIPYDVTICSKIMHTPAQAGLSKKERRKNLHNAFNIQRNNYQHITLIDDLMTTGSTANELARVFKKQGTSQVDIWCCARATITF